MSNIIALRPADDPDHVLEQAKGHYDEVLVIGWNKEGHLESRASALERQEILWLVEMFKVSFIHESL